MAASDVAFLAPELVSEAEGPVPVPAPAEGRLGYRFVKRAFDVAFSLCVAIVGLIPVALLCLAIRLESPGSPIYLQERVGYRGRPLRILKLRTMVADSDDVEKHLSPEQLTQWERERKVDDDPRVTKVGRFLRKTSLDELPQFLNVLAGQMSVVGRALSSRRSSRPTATMRASSCPRSPASPAGGRCRRETMPRMVTAAARSWSSTTCATPRSRWTCACSSERSEPCWEGRAGRCPVRPG